MDSSFSFQARRRSSYVMVMALYYARMRRLLFTIPSYAYLEPSFLAAGKLEHGTIDRKHFPDGERYLRILEDLNGRDVVLLGGTPTDADWLEVFDLACGIARG